MQVRDISPGHRDDPDSREPHALEQPGDVLLVPAQPVHCLREHDLEPAARRVLDQLLNARSKQGRAEIGCALATAMDEGHCGLPEDELGALTVKLLEVPPELVETAFPLGLEAGEFAADMATTGIADSWRGCTTPNELSPSSYAALFQARFPGRRSTPTRRCPGLRARQPGPG
jgi:hypothetical protein